MSELLNFQRLAGLIPGQDDGGISGLPTQVFRVSLSGFAGDLLESITIEDNRTSDSGSGPFTGFDFDGFIFSTVDTNSAGSVPRTTSVPFRNGTAEFSPGSVVADDGGPANLDLNGTTAGGNAVDEDAVRVDQLGTVGDTGYLSLGQGGSLTIEFSNPVDIPEGLFLYVGEWGLSGETIGGSSSSATITIETTTSNVTPPPPPRNELIVGTAGPDTLDGQDGNDTIRGGGGNDSLIGGTGADSLLGEAGNDTLIGNAGADTLSGGNGSDLLLGGDGPDALLGGAGNDTLQGNAGADNLTGGNGADRLVGGGAADTLIGNGGEDRLQGGPGNDRIEGGADGDDAVFNGPSSAYTVTEAGEEITVSGPDGVDTLTSVEMLQFGDGGQITTAGAQRVAYIYAAGLNRDADEGGLNFWIDVREDGLSEVDLAAEFLNSPEFRAFFNGRSVADVSDFDFVTVLYENVLNRAADNPGRTFWLDVLAALPENEARERLLIAFAESNENRANAPIVETLAEVSPGTWAFEDDTESLVVNNETIEAVSTRGTTLLDVLANDSGPEPLRITRAEVTDGLGALSIENDQLLFDPRNNFTDLAEGVTQIVTVNYTVTSGDDQTAVGLATLEVVGAAPTAPVAISDAFDAPSNESSLHDVLANDSDPNGDPLTIQDARFVDGNRPGATVAIDDDQILFSPNGAYDDLRANDNEEVEVEYIVSDGDETDTATLTLKVEATNFPAELKENFPGTETIARSKLSQAEFLSFSPGNYATDSDGDDLFFVNFNSPAGFTLNTNRDQIAVPKFTDFEALDSVTFLFSITDNIDDPTRYTEQVSLVLNFM